MSLLSLCSEAWDTWALLAAGMFSYLQKLPVKSLHDCRAKSDCILGCFPRQQWHGREQQQQQQRRRRQQQQQQPAAAAAAAAAAGGSSSSSSRGNKQPAAAAAASTGYTRFWPDVHISAADLTELSHETVQRLRQNKTGTGMRPCNVCTCGKLLAPKSSGLDEFFSVCRCLVACRSYKLCVRRRLAQHDKARNLPCEGHLPVHRHNVWSRESAPKLC